MIRLTSKYSVNPGVYTKKIKGVTLLFNPLTVSTFVLLEGWGNTMVYLLDGEKDLSVIFEEIQSRFPAIPKGEMVRCMNRLIDEHIVAEIVPKAQNSVIDTKEEPSDHLSFWISLTDQCNFRCKYCFIKKDATFMGEEGYKKTLEKITDLIDKNNPKYVKIHYAGGEPFLNFEMLKKFHNAFLKLARSKKIKIDETAITNGSLITKPVLDFLKKEHLLVSVSLDGLKKENDKTRVYKNGTSTFSQVEKGLLLLYESNVLRNVDIVISSQNINALSPFVMFLLNRKIPFVLNFYKHNVLSGDAFYCKQDELISQLKKIYGKIYAYYKENRTMESPISQLQLLDSVQFKERRTRVCGAGRNYLTFRVDGTLDACPLIYEKEIIRGEKPFHVPSSDWLEGCKNCQWRHLCGGGCAAEKWIKYKNTSHTSHYCHVYKELIPYLINLEGELILHNRIKASFRGETS